MDLALSMGNSTNVTWLFYEDFPYVLTLADKNESIAAVSLVSRQKAQGVPEEKHESMQARASRSVHETHSKMRQNATMSHGSDKVFDQETHSRATRNESVRGSDHNQTLRLSIESLAASALAKNRDIVQTKLQEVMRGINSWAKGAVFVPKVHAYDRCHYERKKSAMHMYRSQVGASSM
jgi:hypothetical protein